MLRSFACCLLVFLLLSSWYRVARAQIGSSWDFPAAESQRIRIDLTHRQVSFQVNGFRAYNEGVANPSQHYIEFAVDANVNFDVHLGAAAFDDGLGHALDARNFGYRIENLGTHSPGMNHKLLGTSLSPSPYATLHEERPLVSSNAYGNAGTEAENRYRILLELGTPPVRQLHDLPPLMVQRIYPGNYSSTVSLVVLPEF
ncbi:MAG: hypothetical protein OHK0039_18900 [Bacteroidia bacterium]